MAIHYLEIVSNDARALTAVYQRVDGLSFGQGGRMSERFMNVLQTDDRRRGGAVCAPPDRTGLPRNVGVPPAPIGVSR